MTKPTLLISNYHEDFTGGGTYVMMILNVLKKYYELYTDKNVEYYYNQYTPHKLNPGEIKLADSSQSFDLHLLAHYRGWVPPRGKRNVQITYYPLQKDITGWDSFFVLNNFCLYVANKFYSIPKHIITPYYDASGFYISDKTVDLINIGHYFIESDGHSKNQHIIIEWFKRQPNLGKIIFHGGLTNPNYFRYLLDISKDDPRIVLKYNRTQEEIRKDLSDSRYLIHAIGYKRTAPEQTEHFGLVAVEALLSGCQPIVHNSGGCPDIPGVICYNDFSDIQLLETNPERLRTFGSRFNIKKTEDQLVKALNLR